MVLACLSSGCGTTAVSDNSVMTYRIISPEPAWIRNGEPIQYESDLWYPRDTVDILTDAEVIVLGKYREVEFYLQAIDVRPYDRLYTKFGKNKFRVFATKSSDDKSKKAF